MCISAPGACGYFVAAWNTAVTYGATGNLSVGVRAGLISGASFWLGGPVGQQNFVPRVLGNGLIGGAASRAMGGHFGRGFLSAGFAAGVKGSGFDTMGLNDNTFMHGAGRTLIAATIGGTTSSIVGGKFANGAYAAAFAHLANYEASHRYKLGPTRMCWTDQSGCTLGNALKATGPVSAPFTDSPVEGRMVIGPLDDPIFHQVDRQNYTITNTTLEGHTFHAGQVVHSLTIDTQLSFSFSQGFYRREGIFLTTTGTGTNACLALCLNSATANYAAGKYLFRDTHKMAPQLMQQYLGNSP